MDLGFGDSNQQIGSAAASYLLQNAVAQERAVENELAAVNALMTDDAALQQLRSKRLQQMRAQQVLEKKYRDLGHGTYTELGPGGQTADSAKAFFQATKESDRLVVHFYRPTSSNLCDIVHKHLEKLARQHMETRFCKINVETAESSDGSSGSGAAYLVEKLGIVVMPTVLVVRNRKVVHHVQGFDELGATLDFSTARLARLLGEHDGLVLTEEERDGQGDDCEQDLVEGVNSVRLDRSSKKSSRGASSRGYYEDDEDED